MKESKVTKLARHLYPILNPGIEWQEVDQGTRDIYRSAVAAAIHKANLRLLDIDLSKTLPQEED